MRGMLAEQNLPETDIEDIVGPLKSGGGQGYGGGQSALGACRKHFAETHRWAPSGGVWEVGGGGGQGATPNGWLAASTRPHTGAYLKQ